MCSAYGLIPTLLGLVEKWDADVGCLFEVVISVDFQAWVIALTTVVEGVVISGIYTYLFVVARRQMRSIASLNLEMARSGSMTSSGSIADEATKMYTCHELNIAFRCLLLIFIHFLCQWPISVLMLLSWNRVAVSRQIPQNLLWLRRLNSAFNPLCYAFAKKDLQQEFKRMPTFRGAGPLGLRS